MVCLAWIVHPVSLASGSNNYHSTALIDNRLLFKCLRYSVLVVYPLSHSGDYR
ncbi:unknown protein [Microcystis aeruginosa NIES-843]|uniref:Uncharacterized protein n=1 Tax=Microcystis aeruginosa (strain NIES-843 / IAM M-2473) TaxID=449447 RepID=B0JRU3_MICAN|nr:unknown protein [Microcystis aeruginosa NIES-843]